MATRIIWQAGENGAADVMIEMPLSSPDAFAWKPGTVRGGDGASLMGEATQTRAQMRLRRLEMQAPTELVRRVEVPGDDEPYFVKRGGFACITFAAGLSGRNKDGLLLLTDGEALAGFCAALLRTFCVVSETDLTSYFETLADARAFVDNANPSTTDAVSMLFYCCLEMNPDAGPEFAAEAKKVWAALAAMPIPSLTPPLTDASDG